MHAALPQLPDLYRSEAFAEDLPTGAESLIDSPQASRFAALPSGAWLSSAGLVIALVSFLRALD